MFLYLFIILFHDTRTSNNILSGVMSRNLSFILDHQIRCKTVKYIDQSDHSTKRLLSLNTLKFSRLIADWLVISQSKKNK